MMKNVKMLIILINIFAQSFTGESLIFANFIVLLDADKKSGKMISIAGLTQSNTSPHNICKINRLKILAIYFVYGVTLEASYS